MTHRLYVLPSAEEAISLFSERRCGWPSAILRLKPRCSLFAARMYPRYKNEICSTHAKIAKTQRHDVQINIGKQTLKLGYEVPRKFPACRHFDTSSYYQAAIPLQTQRRGEDGALGTPALYFLRSFMIL